MICVFCCYWHVTSDMWFLKFVLKRKTGFVSVLVSTNIQRFSVSHKWDFSQSWSFKDKFFFRAWAQTFKHTICSPEPDLEPQAFSQTLEARTGARDLCLQFIWRQGYNCRAIPPETIQPPCEEDEKRNKFKGPIQKLSFNYQWPNYMRGWI